MNSSRNLIIFGKISLIGLIGLVSLTSLFLLTPDYSLALSDDVVSKDWEKQWGGNFHEYGKDVAIDSAGNVYVVGYTIGALQAGSTDKYGRMLLNQEDIILIKYDHNGNHLWNRTWSESGKDYGGGVDVDAFGNSYITGHSDGTQGFATIIVKYNSVGNQLWNKTYTKNLYVPTGHGISVDSVGNAYFLDYELGPDFGPPNIDFLLVKCDSMGTELWKRTWGGIALDRASGVATDLDGNAYVTGYTRSFGIDGNAFLVKYDSSGNELWNSIWGYSSGDQYGRGVTVDSFGNIYVTGYSYGSVNDYIFLVKYDESGTQVWNATWDSAGKDIGTGVAVDSVGNIFISGYTNSFGTPDYDVLLVKYDSSGKELWNVTTGSVINDYGNSVAVDSLDNVYIAGDVHGSGGFDVFLAKYNNTGTEQWSESYGSSEDNDYGRSVKLDSEGSAYLTGYTTSFGAGEDDAILVKYNKYGYYRWSTTWGGADDESGEDLIVDSAKNTFVTGFTESFGKGGCDVFLIKFDSSGLQLWNKTWGGSSHDFGRGIALDSAGNIYIAGDSLSFGVGSKDMILVKYDQHGNQIWNRTWGGPNHDAGREIEIDSDGNVYVVGETSSFGGVGTSAFLIKYNSTGAQVWNVTLAKSDYNVGRGIAIDSTNDIYIMGDIESIEGGTYDAFIAKYNSSGSLLWSRIWGGSNNDFGGGIAVDAKDYAYITGYTNSEGAGNQNVFLAKYNKTGAQLWNKTYGREGSTYYGRKIAIYLDRYIYITGNTKDYELGDNNAFLLRYSMPYANIYPTIPGYFLWIMLGMISLVSLRKIHTYRANKNL